MFTRTDKEKAAKEAAAAKAAVAEQLAAESRTRVATALSLVNRGAPVREAVAALSLEELLELRAIVKWGYDDGHKRDELNALIAAKKG